MSTTPPTITLEVHRGPLAGQTAAVTHSPFRIGSSLHDDWCLADISLGREHFKILLWGHRIELHAHLPDGPVYVNQQRVTSCTLTDQDLILAGENEFRVLIQSELGTGGASKSKLEVPPVVLAEQGLYHLGEAVTRAPFQVDNQRPMFAAPPASRAAVLKFAQKPVLASSHATGVWYGLLDAAQDMALAFEALHEGHDLVSLFFGETARDMMEAAPYFFAVRPGSPWLKKWASANGKHIGLLFDSSAESDEVFQHLRKIFVVTDEAGQEYFFRYYDPRVFRTFLPTCTPADLADFFGPITSFLVESPGADGYLHYFLNASQKLEVVTLGPLVFESAK